MAAKNNVLDNGWMALLLVERLRIKIVHWGIARY